MKDLACVLGYAVKVSDPFSILDTLEHFVKFLITSKHENFLNAKEFIEKRPRPRSSFALKTMSPMDDTERRSTARLDEERD